MIFAGRSSRLGLPEVTIGVIPGAGGTQRLTNTLGKYRVRCPLRGTLTPTLSYPNIHAPLRPRPHQRPLSEMHLTRISCFPRP